MKIFLSPQVSDVYMIEYAFSEGVITASINGKSDTFDFRDFGDGKLVLREPETDNYLIETNLDVQPIISARRENGILYVELLNFIGFDASYEERFPEWIDHSEYEPPREEDSDGEDEVEE